MNRYDYLNSQYPQHVILMKEGQFYSIRKESAYIVHELLKFRMYIARGEFCTGCPVTTLGRVVQNLKEREVNYLIMNRDEVEEHMEFEHNHYSDFQSVFDAMEEVRKNEIARISEQALDKEVLHKSIEVLEKWLDGIQTFENQDTSLEELYSKEEFTEQELEDALHYTVPVLKEVLSKGKVAKSNSLVHKAFHIDKELAMQLLTDEEIKISSFVALLNQKRENQFMKSLNATAITNWLVDAGYLIETEKDEKKCRIATSLGESIGIKTVEREGRNGIYFINLYNHNAQAFLAENIDAYQK